MYLYKILNWIFGWDYVAWKNENDSRMRGIVRIFIDGTGKCRYDKNIYMNFEANFVEIKNADEVVWLTCKPEKYLNNEEG